MTRLSASAAREPSLYPSKGQLAVLVVQLTLVSAAIHLFRIEENFGFLQFTPILLGGFVVHAVLPPKFRLPFFVFLSCAALVMLLGVKSGVGLVVLTLCFLFACHLPIPLIARVAVLLAGAGALVLVRVGLLNPPWNQLQTRVIPILASMIMFRVVIYLYDLQNEKNPASLWHRLAYFFILPNPFFPLFPVIDYRTFVRNYYDTDACDIYQKGIQWMMRGVVHLVFYRFVYHYLTPVPSEVQDLGGVLIFLVSSYLLYLRVSGIFHLIVGILCLFGFNLPETHHLYFFASSFTDLWRRINIYWKDFMLKMVYYPIFMRIRKWGMNRALFISTVVTLVCSWLLHSYQLLWLVGEFPLKLQDGVFWTLLGVLVAFNTLIEANTTKRRTLKKKAFALADALSLSIKTVAMFTFMCLLWSFWTGSSVAEWASTVGQASNSGLSDWLLLALGWVVAVVIGVAVQLVQSKRETSWSSRKSSFRATAIATTAIAVVVLLMGTPRVSAPFGTKVAAMAETLRGNSLNKRDEALAARGYYEELLGTETFTTALWNSRAERPGDWQHIVDTEVTRDTDNILLYEFVPNFEMIHKRVTLKTNQWAMRDKEYTQEKPPGTFRFAILGESEAMGTGVELEDAFQTIVEERLNREQRSGTYTQFEILNFSVGGYTVLQQVMVSQTRLAPFEPDAAILVAHSNFDAWIVDGLRKIVQAEVPIAYPYINEVLEKSGVRRGMDATEIRRRLAPFSIALVEWSYAQIVAACRELDVQPILLYIPFRDVPADEDERIQRLRELGESAGFVFLRLEGVFDGYDPRILNLAPWDSHPNTFANSLIADALYQSLIENQSALNLDLLDRD